MFFGTGFFWMLMGIILVLIAFAFKAFAEDFGWKLTWWKSTLAVLWYGLFSINFYAYGTLAGENEAAAGFRVMLVGLFITLILGVGLWRLMVMEFGAGEPQAKPAPKTEATPEGA